MISAKEAQEISSGKRSHFAIEGLQSHFRLVEERILANASIGADYTALRIVEFQPEVIQALEDQGFVVRCEVGDYYSISW
jgi:hypothetical protein